jgi:hypothetical protein
MNRYRGHAEEARRHAEKAINPRDKEEWLKLAAEWAKLAQATDDGRQFSNLETTRALDQ